MVGVLFVFGIIFLFIIPPLGILLFVLAIIGLFLGFGFNVTKNITTMITKRDCPYCKSNINAKAIICPICQSRIG